MIIGTTINSRYDIKMLIGDGGMANVYLAYDRTLKRHVAIKMLRYELSKDERFIKRFKRESAQVINLDHPNIDSAVFIQLVIISNSRLLSWNMLKEKH